MEERARPLESLFESAESYAKTNVDLFKLKTIDKSADIVSTVVSKVVMIVTTILIAGLVNIGLALWIGELLGKSYYGFFAVAGFYVVVAMFVSLLKEPLIKKPVSNAVILSMRKERIV